MKALILALSAAILAACAQGSFILTGTARPAIDPSAVKIYSAPPPAYEIIGHVNASSADGWTAQSRLDRAVNELRNQAAKVGANGVLLAQAGQSASGTAGVFVPNAAGGGGMFVGSSGTREHVGGYAIYVPQAD